MPTKIFIGNLSSDTTPDDIRPLFEKHGKVTECAVLKNYGFVHMENESDAKAAISKLDGTFVRAQKMRVEMSTGRKGYGPGSKDKRGPPRSFSSRGPPAPFPPPSRDSYDRYPPPSPYDRYDSPYSRYPYSSERDYYPSGLPGERYPPRMPPPPPPGERYPPPVPRERLPPPERSLPPPVERRPYTDPRDRLPLPPRERLPPAYDDRSPYERGRVLERVPPAQDYYRERSPLNRPPPDYYDRPKPPAPQAPRHSLSENGYPNGYDYYRSDRASYDRPSPSYYDRARSFDRPAVPQTSSYYSSAASGGFSSSAASNGGPKTQYDSQSQLQTAPIFF